MSVKAFVTFRGSNPVSVGILEMLLDRQEKDPSRYPCRIIISETETEATVAARAEPDAVALLDSKRYEIRRFSPSRASDLAEKPAWIGEAKWVVEVNPAPFTTAKLKIGLAQEESEAAAAKSAEVYRSRMDSCADQLRAMFIANFAQKTTSGLAPWESPMSPKPKRGKTSRGPHWGWRPGLKSLRCYA